MSELTKAQVRALAKHKVHHTAGHMKSMSSSMQAGMSFKKAHIVAKRIEKHTTSSRVPPLWSPTSLSFLFSGSLQPTLR